MKEIDKLIVINYRQFKQNIFWSPDNTLYKLCSFFPNRQKRIEFLKYIYGLENVPGMVLPQNILYDYEIYGYEIPYINGSIDLEEYINGKRKDIDIKAIIASLFEAINEIHKYIIFGDVRNANILIKDDKAIFIDFDYGTKKGTNEKTLSYYCVFDQYFDTTILEDLAKTFISALCLYYHINFESFMDYNSLYILKELLVSARANKEIINCLNQIILAYENKKIAFDFDFLGMFKSIDLPSKKEMNRLRTKINSQG